MEEYCGFTNRATWNVVLWVMNTEWMYRTVVAGEHPYGPRSAKRMARNLMGERTPDRFKLGSLVNWKEVAEAFNEAS